MAVHNLDIFDEEHFDFDIFSITSTESIYTVISALNTALNIDFQLQELLEFSHKDGEQFYFPLYRFLHDDLNIEFNLVANQTSFQPEHANKVQPGLDLFGGDVERTTKLIPELEKSDYFLIIKGDNRYLHNHAIFEAIRFNPSFITVFEIYLENLKDKKSKSNLLF